ncbi:A/G-specific adenine glycosylase [Variovorax sp. VNK109]|uniref:A/G-specific adenine glycosylase n=1 Tax=Variovorax sp. VNK109 TaxID=3400919 RepID=UPI003C1293FE
MSGAPASLAARVVRWQRSHGRSHLPWQNTRDPYRVWLSEIMLQQTQVSTVIGYFERFLARFPDVGALAAAGQDDVLGLWSGLGYYSRARNLHRCAQEVVERFGGEFPRTAEQLQTLPGIGRSTAAAVASFCFGERVAILDGNVKRVLARALGFGGDLASSANEKKLWNEATALLPADEADMPAYTQGLMDLGATVCLPRKPACLLCPLQDICAAVREGQPEKYPVKTRKLKRTAQSLWLLWAGTKDGAVWLHKRPSTGIWAGLYCLPVFDSHESLASAVPAPQRDNAVDLPVFTHVLTHKDLHIHPVQIQLPANEKLQAEGAWVEAARWPQLGLPAPVRKLLGG